MSADDYDPSPSNDELEAHLQTRNMVINLGPSHPAMHGTVRMKVELDGETIVKVDTEVGFLHRGFQKSCENVTWTQCLPYTDRLNYVSALGNNFGFIHAVEKLMCIDIPERAKYIRVIGAELHRMADHLTATGALGLELGAFAAFLYGVEARELIFDRVTELTGARLTTNFGRIGGMNRDLPPGWKEKVIKTLDKIAGARRRSRSPALAQPHLRRPLPRHRHHHHARRARLRLLGAVPSGVRRELRRSQAAPVLGLRQARLRRARRRERRQLRSLPGARRRAGSSQTASFDRR